MLMKILKWIVYPFYAILILVLWVGYVIGTGCEKAMNFLYDTFWDIFE